MTEAYYVRATIEGSGVRGGPTTMIYVAMADTADEAVSLVKSLRGTVAKCEATGEVASETLKGRWNIKPGMAFAV